MKLKKFIYCVLRIFTYITCLAGGFLFLGAVGGLEWDDITFAQFWLYEFFAFCLMVITVIVYNIRENFKYYYIEN